MKAENFLKYLTFSTSNDRIFFDLSRVDFPFSDYQCEERADNCCSLKSVSLPKKPYINTGNFTRRLTFHLLDFRRAD